MSGDREDLPARRGGAQQVGQQVRGQRGKPAPPAGGVRPQRVVTGPVTVQRDTEGTVALREPGGDRLGVRRAQRAAQFQDQRTARRQRHRLMDHGKNSAPRHTLAAHPPSQAPGPAPAARRTGPRTPYPTSRTSTAGKTGETGTASRTGRVAGVAGVRGGQARRARPLRVRVWVRQPRVRAGRHRAG
ncbi:hypothetical protein [Streptomyces sp. OK228]|uniref:hypothetical protein n=1 Tax=Streptomyces sp. OK228 TaxID=1882786 RepID=UPI000BCE2F66|nr:hypothetical protein [Streptomyces sp. OK228]SOE39767.1 hypothetical protein SAMN05442782_11183 [Streptomyces sp. OK228]